MSSACFPKAATSTKVTSSRSSPCALLNLRLQATPNSATGVWLGRYLSCGSRVRLPINSTRLKLATGSLREKEPLVAGRVSTRRLFYQQPMEHITLFQPPLQATVPRAGLDPRGGQRAHDPRAAGGLRGRDR